VRKEAKAVKLIDLDQQIFVPVVDETHGGVTVEMKMTVGEFFEKCCAGFAPEVVEAIPVEWLKAQESSYTGDVSDIGKSAKNGTIKNLIRKWQKEQEAQDG
jgi:hypothetical protein